MVRASSPEPRLECEAQRDEMDKYFIFRNYWRIAAAVAVIAIVVIFASGSTGRESLIAITLGTALAFCYFVQSQKLDELRLFKDLFTDFNCRYDKMNDTLENIRAGNGRNGAEVKKTLVDYFNLCAEECLFFRGRIHSPRGVAVMVQWNALLSPRRWHSAGVGRGDKFVFVPVLLRSNVARDRTRRGQALASF